MKTNKIIVILLTIIVLFGLTFKSYATDEVVEDTTETSNPVTDIPTENNTGNENQNSDNNENNTNQNENPGDQENTPQETNGEENTNTETNNKENSNEENSGNTSQTPNPSNESNNSNSENRNSSNSTGGNSNSNYSNRNSDNSNNSTVESSNANLKSLSVDVEGLSPEFDKSNLEYYLVIGLSVESVNVVALPEDAKAQVTVIGNNDLEEGENTIRITVKAENGNTKTYIIHVTKTDDAEWANADLKALSVNGFNIYPTFKANIYTYSLTINEEISQLEILAETENAEATYEIVGNENLAEGNNLIKIVVTAKNGEAKREYKINAYISTQNIKTKASNTKQAIVILAVLGVAIAGISFALYKKKQ